MKDFDVVVDIKVRVEPIACPLNTGEGMIWRQVENKVNFEAMLLAKSLESYFEHLIKRYEKDSQGQAIPQ